MCFLVLHDVAAPYVEIVSVRVAEPVVDDHGQVKSVFGVYLDIKVDRQLHDEVVLVKYSAVLVLPNAEMNGQRRQPTFLIDKLAIQFHVVVASTQHIGPKHLRLGWVVEDTGLVVGFVEAKGEAE